MRLLNLLKLLEYIGTKNDIKPIYIVGGAARDKFLGRVSESLNDIDITTCNDKVSHLAKEFAIILRKHMPVASKQAADGHISLHLKNLKVDFSSNFLVPNIEQLLTNINIEPSEINKEIYSRDFFCNTLLMSLDLSKIKDPSKQGIADIEKKMIRTCLDPENTFKYNTNRIIRVPYLSAKLGFNVDSNIIKWIRNNPEYLLKCDKEYLSKNIDKALSYDADRAVYLFNKMAIWDYLPMTDKLSPYYTMNIKKEIIYGK